MLSVVAALSFAACAETSDDEPTALPRLIKSVPADGDTSVPTTTTEVTLEYDQQIMYKVQTAPITINGQSVTVDWEKRGTKVLALTKLKLQRGQTVNIEIPQGAVTNIAGDAAEAQVITFSTENPTTQIPTTVVTPDALPATQQLYTRLCQSYGKRCLTASMANVNWNFAEAELVHEATGKYPDMATMDYIHLASSAPNSWINYADLSAVKQWDAKGGMLAASWHWMVPLTPESSDVAYAPGDGHKNAEGNQTTTFRARNIFIDGTWEQQWADASLAKMADLLLLLQQQNISVIWRPLHEAAGNTYNYPNGKAWFWWGYDGGEVYVSLWHKMFNYFAERGVRNLIWVWTTQTSNAQNHDDAFYPGDEYVDIIGCDIYNAQTPAIVAQYREMQSLWPNKMLCLSECGNVSLLSEQWAAGAQWLYAMPWYQYNATTLDNHQYADTHWWQDAMGQ